MRKSISTLLASALLLATVCCLNMTTDVMGMSQESGRILASVTQPLTQQAGCHEVVVEDDAEQQPSSCNIANAPDSALAGKVMVDFQLPTVSSVATVYAFALLAPESPIPGFARAPPPFFQYIEHKNTVVLRA